MRNWPEVRPRAIGQATALAALAWLCAVISAQAQGAPERRTIPPAAVACNGCHGALKSAAIPPLSGRDAATTLAAMQAFRSGTRAATVMDRIARGFSDPELEAVAAWFAEEARQ